MKIIVCIYEQIKKEATAIIDFYGNNDPKQIIEYLGVLIIPSKLGKIKGFLQYHQNYFIIHINETIDSDIEIDKVLAHELGHYFLHKSLNCFKLKLHTLSFANKLEYEANLFASELLLTDEMLKKEYYYIESMNTKELSVYFNLDIDLVENKLTTIKKHANFFYTEKERAFP